MHSKCAAVKWTRVHARDIERSLKLHTICTFLLSVANPLCVWLDSRAKCYRGKKWLSVYLFRNRVCVFVCNRIRCTVCSFIIYVAFYWCFCFYLLFFAFVQVLHWFFSDAGQTVKFVRTHDIHRCSRMSGWLNKVFFWFPKIYCVLFFRCVPSLLITHFFCLSVL